MNALYEERLRQKNSLIAILAEDLQDFQRIIDTQKFEILKLNNVLVNQGKGMKVTRNCHQSLSLLSPTWLLADLSSPQGTQIQILEQRLARFDATRPRSASRPPQPWFMREAPFNLSQMGHYHGGEAFYGSVFGNHSEGVPQIQIIHLRSRSPHPKLYMYWLGTTLIKVSILQDQIFERNVGNVNRWHGNHRKWKKI